MGEPAERGQARFARDAGDNERKQKCRNRLQSRSRSLSTQPHGCPGCFRPRLRRPPASSSPMARAPAWLTPSWRRSRTGLQNATSRRCAISFPTWRRAKRPDPPKVAHATVRAAVSRRGGWLRPAALCGRKSFGGRMTSQAQAERPLTVVRGLVFLGFPLHPANRPSREAPASLRRDDPDAVFAGYPRCARSAERAWTRCARRSATGQRSSSLRMPIIPSMCRRAPAARMRRFWRRCWMR